ncbi:hypothetical protein E3Q16_00379 [Wallemia mellicola]|nr:hypothetical protein E3Q16_00379 [Wallemia mellicola]
MPFKLFKKKSKSDLKKGFHRSEISRPLALPFPSSVSLHDIRDSLIHPIPDLRTRRRSKSTSTTASNPDKKSPEIFPKDVDPFAPPVPKIPAAFQNGDESARSSTSQKDENTQPEFLYRDSQSSRLGQPIGETSGTSKTEPPQRPARTRRPIPFGGMTNFMKRKTNSPENEKASPSSRTAKSSITQSMRGLGMKNKSVRHSASDESFESFSISSISVRTPPLQVRAPPPPRPMRSPPPAPNVTRGRSTTVSGVSTSQESQINHARLSTASQTINTRKRSNSSPSGANPQSNKPNAHSSLHSIPFSLQAIQPSSSVSTITNARSSSGISINMHNNGTPATQSINSSHTPESNEVFDSKIAPTSDDHDQSSLILNSTFSSFNDGNNSFDPSQFLNSYTKDDSYSSFELDKSVLSPSSSKRDFNNTSLMAIGPSSSSQKFVERNLDQNEEVVSNGTKDGDLLCDEILFGEENNEKNNEKKNNEEDDQIDKHQVIENDHGDKHMSKAQRERSKIFSSLDAVKKHMSIDSFNDDDDMKDSSETFLDTLSNFSSPPPLLDLRPPSYHEDQFNEYECEQNKPQESLTKKPEDHFSDIIPTSSHPSQDSFNKLITSEIFVDAKSDVESDKSKQVEEDVGHEHELKKDSESIIRDSMSIYDEDEMSALQQKIEAMAQKLEEMRQSELPEPLQPSSSKEALPPSFSFQLDPEEHPELQDDVEFIEEEPLPQDIALPEVQPDEIALPESPVDDTDSSEKGEIPRTRSFVGHHAKTSSVNGSIEEHIQTSSSFHVTNASQSSRSSQEEEEEDNRIIKISPESRKNLQTQLRRLSKEPPKTVIPSEAPKPKPKPAQASPKKIEMSASRTSFKDWMPTPLSPKITEEVEPTDESAKELSDVQKRPGLRESDLNVDREEPKMIHPPRYSSYKASGLRPLQGQLQEKKQNDRRMRDTWLKPPEGLSPTPRTTFDKSRRISQQPIDNRTLPKRYSSKAAKSNISFQSSIENEFDSIISDPTGDKRRSELENQQQKAKAAMEAVWKAARSSSVPPVEQYAISSKQRKSLILPQKKLSANLPYSAPAIKTSFASGLEGVRSRDSQPGVPALPSMRSFRQSIETPQYNPRLSDQRIKTTVEHSFGTPSKSTQSLPKSRKSRPIRLDQLGTPQSKSYSHVNAIPISTPPLTPGTASTISGYDNIMTPRSFTHKPNVSASSMDSMSAQSTSSDNHQSYGVQSFKKNNLNAPFLQHSSSAYSLKQDSGIGYAI